MTVKGDGPLSGELKDRHKNPCKQRYYDGHDDEMRPLSKGATSAPTASCDDVAPPFRIYKHEGAKILRPSG